MLSVLLIAGIATYASAGESKADKKRAELNKMADETLKELWEKEPKSKRLYDDAYGVAVFQNLKIALGFSGGGGSGVAAAKRGTKKYYMKMATGGIGLGLGGQKYRIVFLFEDKETFDKFVEKGWDADASASAVAGTKGANEAANFRDGMAVFQFSDKGLMARADLAGTKYWVNDKLTNKDDDSD